jgi:uncharacterized protein YlxP (DUF503 family)
VHVALLQVRLHIQEASSLKEKRQIVKSILDRARHRYQVAAAETDDQDLHRIAVLGFAAVSESESHARSIATKLLDTLLNHPAARVIEHELETL